MYCGEDKEEYQLHLQNYIRWHLGKILKSQLTTSTQNTAQLVDKYKREIYLCSPVPWEQLAELFT